MKKIIFLSLAIMFAVVEEVKAGCDHTIPLGCKISWHKAAQIAGGNPDEFEPGNYVDCPGGEWIRSHQIMDIQFVSGMCQLNVEVNCETAKVEHRSTEWDCWSGW